MKETYVRTPVGEVQIQTDGRTVWVNHSTGCMIGRFSSKGIDVHHLPSDKNSKHCLDCRPGLLPYSNLPREEEWLSFIASMKKHHGIEVPQHTLVEFLSPVEDLVACASRAEEVIPLDELEEHAEEEH